MRGSKQAAESTTGAAGASPQDRSPAAEPPHLRLELIRRGGSEPGPGARTRTVPPSPPGSGSEPKAGETFGNVLGAPLLRMTSQSAVRSVRERSEGRRNFRFTGRRECPHHVVNISMLALRTYYGQPLRRAGDPVRASARGCRNAQTRRTTHVVHCEPWALWTVKSSRSQTRRKRLRCSPRTRDRAVKHSGRTETRSVCHEGVTVLPSSSGR